MNISPETERRIQERIAKRCYDRYHHLNPAMTQEDFRQLTVGNVGNMMAYSKYERWIRETIPHITEELLDWLRKKPNNLFNNMSYFLMCESHGSDFCAGYVPLSERGLVAHIADS